MKKILLQFALLFLVVAALFLVAGRTEGWIEPPEEEATGDIILSGTKYNGKVVVNITLHPDGTGEHEGNGEKSPATWEAGEGDVAMVVHFNMKGTDYDMDVIDTGSGYSAMYPLVADFELKGSKPVKDITLSGTKYNGKVVVNITLHPDGTGEHEGNGDKTPATWEAGEGDVAMVVHFNVKGTDYDMNVIDNGTQYVADYPLVADFQLAGGKAGAVAASVEAEEEAAASAEESEKKETESAETKPAESKDEEGYPANTFVLPFTADINEQLSTTFFSESSVWGPALGASGSYSPSDSKDILFSWSNKGKSNEMDFLADGTYEYRFTKMGITEHGTWNFADWKIVLTSEGGKEQPAELIKGETATEQTAPAEEEKKQKSSSTPADSNSDEVSYPANTFVLPFTADINEQLSTTFFSESSVWGPALGASGSYTPTESEDLLFSWSNKGQSNKLDFFANGIYEYQFTKMGIVEHGTWSFTDWKITLNSAGGKEQPAELIKGEEAEEQSALSEESEKKEAESAETKPAESKDEEGYPANTFVLPFTADINEQLQTTFFSESSVWGPALGASGSYAPTESEDLLFSWSNKGQSNKLDFFANGTYEYQFTKMNIVEHGTWNFDGWKLSVTTEAGRVMDAELIK